MDSNTLTNGNSDDVISVRETIKTILDAMYEVDKNNIAARVEVAPGLLEMAISEIDQWKELANDFASCIVIKQGEIKPRITVDIEKFLETQHNYQAKINGL